MVGKFWQGEEENRAEARTPEEGGCGNNNLPSAEREERHVSFLSMLLQAAIHLETMVGYQLEKRMGLQLDQAVLDDLLIPSFSFTGHTLFDVDFVERIVKNYLEYDAEGKHLGCSVEGSLLSPPQRELGS